MLRKTKKRGVWPQASAQWTAQKLLQQQFPLLNGLQSPLLSQNNGFCPVTRKNIQIHHTGQFHCMGDLLFDRWQHLAVWQQVQGRWFVILTSGAASADLQDMHHKRGGWRGWLQVPWDQCSSSPIATSGGVFAITFAYHAARGDNLSNIKFQQEKMRQHLAHCFKKKRLEPFPHTTLEKPHG